LGLVLGSATWTGKFGEAICPSLGSPHHAPLPRDELTVYEGIPSATVHRVLLDCAPIIMSDRFDNAVAKAGDEGLLTAHQVSAIQSKGKP